MLTAKLISIILTFLAALAQFRARLQMEGPATKMFSKARTGLLSLYTVGAFISMILVVVDDEQSSRLVSSLREIRDSLSTQATQAAQREKEAISSTDKVRVELAGLKRALLPFQELASKKFPMDPPDLALSKLLSAVTSLQNRTSQLERSTAEIASQDLFRAVSDPLKNQVLANLRTLKNRFAIRLREINVFCVVGNRSRQLFAKEVDDCLRSVGLPGKPMGFGFISGAPAPVQLTFHDEDLDIAEALARALSPIVKTQFSGFKDSKTSKGLITISIAGTPIFSEDGSVETR